MSDVKMLKENKKLEYLQSIIDAMENELKKKSQIIVAIDGCAASGKTTAAAYLAAYFDANVIHMDDFFLPFEMRSKERMEQPAGNIHHERLTEQVCKPLLEGKTFLYTAYSCAVGGFMESKMIMPKPVTIFEGAYCMYPGWVPYDIGIFFKASPKVQHERVLKRNGPEKLEAFQTRFIPMENKYFEIFGIPERARLCFDTSEVF